MRSTGPALRHSRGKRPCFPQQVHPLPNVLGRLKCSARLSKPRGLIDNCYGFNLDKLIRVPQNSDAHGRARHVVRSKRVPHNRPCFYEISPVRSKSVKLHTPSTPTWPTWIPVEGSLDDSL